MTQAAVSSIAILVTEPGVAFHTATALAEFISFAISDPAGTAYRRPCPDFLSGLVTHDSTWIA